MGTILVVHDELNSLELPVFKKDDRSKPELRYFPNHGKLLAQLTLVQMPGNQNVVHSGSSDHNRNQAIRHNGDCGAREEEVVLRVNAIIMAHSTPILP